MENNSANKTGELTKAKHTKSESSWIQVLQWIKRCSLKHVACKRNSSITPRFEWPTRLIYVGDTDSRSVSLVETIELERSTMAYMTLSHCWGHHIPVQLLTDNYSSFLKGMKLSDLPKTYRDAIMVTRNLEVTFLWIDSLCIIQDSASDWASESSKMTQVYQNSCLNLAAGASQDSTGGLFCPRSPLGIAP
jgi:hypothetical protein